MKKQDKKPAKEKPASKKVAKKSKTKKETAETPKEETPQPQAEQPIPLPETPTPLSIEDRRRLEFKYGARILDDDLTGTRAEVIHKVSEKIGETPEALTIMLNTVEFSG